MLNKIDKWFIISLIILIVSFVLPILLVFTLVRFDIKYLFEILFIIFVINYFIFIPILFFTQIITFIVKIIAKNKCKKDWIIILSNFMSILFFVFLILFSYGAAMTL